MLEFSRGSLEDLAFAHSGTFTQFMPRVDVGIDLSKEYAAVKGMKVFGYSLSAFNKASLASA